MSDIFISYKREEQSVARKLADALEKKGWSVWWDPKLRAGEHFDDVIEAALQKSKCVIVMWSKLSVQSRYVKDEASYALKRQKLVPISIEEVDLPFRFEGVHTEQLLDWDALASSQEFQKLVGDIEGIVGPPPAAAQKEAAQKKRPTKKAGIGPAWTLEPHTIFRDKLRDGSEGPEMVVLPAGEFFMGSRDSDKMAYSNEMPQHRVQIPKSFAVGRYPVTFDEYDRFAEATDGERPEDEERGRGRWPVLNVSWDDAKAYVTWLADQTSKSYRLLSEAEWEYACRAGTTTRYSFGDEITAKDANYGRNGKISEVGSYPANPWGLCDMHGNVYEWVEDCLNDSYKGAPTDGTAWTKGDCEFRVLRGGSWFTLPEDLGSASRGGNFPDIRLRNSGFRVARTLDR